jgi:hypothetical protein
MSGKLWSQAVDRLASAKASIRCSELTQLLTSLGFEVRNGKLGSHKVFFHDGLPDFHSGSFNGDHGRDPQIKRPYIIKVLRILRQHESDLKSFLGESTP